MSALQHHQRRSALRALKADLKQVQALLDQSEALRSLDLSSITQKVNDVTTEISRAVAQPTYRHPGQQAEQVEDAKGTGKFQPWSKKAEELRNFPPSSALSALPLMTPVNGPTEPKAKAPSSQLAFPPASCAGGSGQDDDDDMELDEPIAQAPKMPMPGLPLSLMRQTGGPPLPSMAGMRPGSMEPSGPLGALAALNGSFMQSPRPGLAHVSQMPQMHGMWPPSVPGLPMTSQQAMGMGLGSMGAGGFGQSPLQSQHSSLQAGLQVLPNQGGLLGTLESAISAANASAGLAGNYGCPGPQTVSPPGALKPLPDPGLPPGARETGAPQAAFDPAELAARLAAGAGPSEIATHLAAGATSHAADAKTKPMETPSNGDAMRKRSQWDNETSPPPPPPSLGTPAAASTSLSPAAVPPPVVQSPPPPPPDIVSDAQGKPLKQPSTVPAIPSFTTMAVTPSPASAQAQTAQAQLVAAAALAVQQQAAASKEAASSQQKATPAFKGAFVMGRPPVGQPAQAMSFGAFGRPKPPVSDSVAQAFSSNDRTSGAAGATKNSKSLSDVFSAEVEEKDVAPPAPPDRRGALAPVKDSMRSIAEERDASSVKPWWQMSDPKRGRSHSGSRRNRERSRSRSRRRPSPKPVSRKGTNFDKAPGVGYAIEDRGGSGSRSRARDKKKKDKKDDKSRRDRESRSRDRNRKKTGEKEKEHRRGGESRSASRKVKRAERSWSRGRGTRNGSGGGMGGGGGDIVPEFFQPLASRSQSNHAELTVEISEGITERTSRLGLKKKMQVFGDVEVCHMGNRAIDLPFVRFRTAGHADAAHLGLQNGEVFLDGMVLRGHKKGERPLPAGALGLPPEQPRAVQDADAGGGRSRSRGGKRRSPSKARRRRSRSGSDRGGRDRGDRRSREKGERETSAREAVVAASAAPAASPTTALAVPTPKAVPPPPPGGVAAATAIPDWLSDLVPAASSGRMLRPREVMVPQQFVARLIGRGGDVIMAICNATGADVKIRQETKEMGYSLAVISGSEQAMNLAENMVRQRLGLTGAGGLP